MAARGSDEGRSAFSIDQPFSESGLRGCSSAPDGGLALSRLSLYARSWLNARARSGSRRIIPCSSSRTRLVSAVSSRRRALICSSAGIFFTKLEGSQYTPPTPPVRATFRSSVHAKPSSALLLSDSWTANHSQEETYGRGIAPAFSWYSPGVQDGIKAAEWFRSTQDSRHLRRDKRMSEKKWASEEQINARIRELTGEIRQLRQELRQPTQPAHGHKPHATDTPRRRRSRSKKR